MKTKFSVSVLCAAAVAALLGPVAAHANSTQGVDTCMQKFVSEYLPAGTQVRVGPGTRLTASDFRMGARPRVTVYAVGETTGKDYGSATCVINRRGDLALMYVDGALAYFAARDAQNVRVAGR